MLKNAAKKASRVAVLILVTAAGVSVEAGGLGTDVVLMGGGSVEDALLANGQTADATFSIFFGFDKHDNPKGSFFMKRVFPGKGVRAIDSTEITEIDVDLEGDPCPWVEMKGVATLHKNWGNRKPNRNENFHVKAWDCDGIPGHVDRIWFGDWVGSYNWRPALTLYFDEYDSNPAVTLHPADLASGEIMIR
jgi:hypothetical protein